MQRSAAIGIDVATAAGAGTGVGILRNARFEGGEDVGQLGRGRPETLVGLGRPDGLFLDLAAAPSLRGA